MKLCVFAAGLAVAAWASVASAYTIGFTEGARPDVVGTDRVTPRDAGNVPLGFDLTAGSGPLTADGTGPDEILIHGRIVGANDYYQFRSDAPFVVEWNFDGYETAGGFVPISGFVADDSSGSTSTLVLDLVDAVGLVIASFAVEDVMTPVTDGDPVLFAAGPGHYSFGFRGETQAALYDLRVSTVPVPPSLGFLMAALAGLAFVRHRRSV